MMSLEDDLLLILYILSRILIHREELYDGEVVVKLTKSSYILIMKSDMASDSRDEETLCLLILV